MLTWDSKITTVIGMLGGFADAVSRGLSEEGLLLDFYNVIQTEWTPKFPKMNGLGVEYALPSYKPPQARDDFVTCRYKGFGQDFQWGVATAAY